jgi:O-antigen ligase
VERFTADDRHSAESRIWYSKLALNAIREHMFTGIGANNQHFAVADDAYAPPEMIGQERTAIHNTYLATWVELGLLGLVAFIWLLMAGGRRALSASRRTLDRYASVVITGFFGALTVFALHMAVGTFTDRRPEFLWLILALIAVTGRLASQAQELEEPVTRPEPGGIVKSALSLDTPGLDSSQQCGGR